MSRTGLVVLVLAAALASGCSATGTDRTDEEARSAVSDLGRHDTVLGYAHAVQDGGAAGGEVIDVMLLEDFGEDRNGRLVIRLEDPATTGVFSGRAAVLACYEVRLDTAGAVDGPHGVSCPAAQALSLPPDPARALPPDLPQKLERMLRDLPSELTDQDVVDALRGVLHSAEGRPSNTFIRQDDSVGIQVYSGGGHPCLLASRQAGQVRVRTQPFEQGCSADDALLP